tara:strand:+ start:516 stop:1163 length:648 start_codon:yes stop_codon:yes gene_type:complete
MKYLITSGCSFTEGLTVYKQNPWPYHLAKLMDYELINTALGGRGNYYISNQIYSTLSNTKYTSSNTKVVVMWSGMDRVDIFRLYRNKEKWFGTGGIPKDESDLFWEYYERYHTIEDSYLHTLQRILGVQEFLKNRKIPYLFLTYMNIFESDDISKLQTIKELYKLIDWDKFHFHESTDGFDEWNKYVGLEFGPERHPTEEAHEQYAKYLYNLKLL